MRAWLIWLLLAGGAQAEMHLAEIRQGILGCESAACIGAGAALCMEMEDDGQTTFGMMSCLIAERDVWDERLNNSYREALNFAGAMDKSDLEYFPEYAVRKDQLRAAQRAWIPYRDANCAMWYGLWGSGSMRQIEGADCLMQMTARRTLELEDYTETMR